MKLSKRYIVCETQWDQATDRLYIHRIGNCTTRKEALEIIASGRPHRMQRFFFKAEVRER